MDNNSKMLETTFSCYLSLSSAGTLLHIFTNFFLKITAAYCLICRGEREQDIKKIFISVIKKILFWNTIQELIQDFLVFGGGKKYLLLGMRWAANN